MGDLSEAYQKAKQSEMLEAIATRPIYLVVRRTQSHKVHPNEIYGYTFDREEAHRMASAGRVALDVLTVLPLSAEEPRANVAVPDQPYDCGSGV